MRGLSTKSARTLFLVSPYGLFAHGVRGFCACARPRKRGGATIAGAIGMRLFAFVMMPGGIAKANRRIRPSGLLRDHDTKAAPRADTKRHEKLPSRFIPMPDSAGNALIGDPRKSASQASAELSCNFVCRKRGVSCRGGESSRQAEGGCLPLAKTSFGANGQTGGFKSRQRLTRRTVFVVARQRQRNARTFG